MTALLVAAGAVLGAPARFLLDRWLSERLGWVFPVGTFVVNVAGSFILGVLTGAGLSHDAYAFSAIGFCGAFTTFSTFGWETDRLLEDGSARVAVANIALSVTVGLVAAAVGWWLGSR